MLAAASQRASRIRLGTAIIPMDYEHPLRLAEDAATVAALMSPVVVGEPTEIVEYLRQDAAVAAAGELMIFLPPGFDQPQTLELIENIALHVAPQLGRTPAD